MGLGKSYRVIFLLAMVFLFVAVFVSCHSDKKRKAERQTGEIRKEIEEYVYPLPSVFEVTQLLNAIEAGYIAGITSNPTSAGAYFTEKGKAVNLGIYAADLAYVITYNKKPEVQTYFSACEALVRELDLTRAFRKDLADQIEANTDKKEQLVEIITGMLQNVYNYLNKQGRAELSYLIVAGTVIEGLYLTTHISENNFQNPELIKAILYQKGFLLKLEELMEESKDSEMIKEVYPLVQEINSIYAMTEGGAMTEEQVLLLSQTIGKIRGNYVSE